MRSIIYVFIIAFVCLVLFSKCKNTGTGPDNNITKSPSDMKWKVDTLQHNSADQTLMSNILGLSSTNIYIYGHCSDMAGEIYKYNGSAWSSISYSPALGGIEISKMISFDKHTLYGAGEDESQVVGANISHTCWLFMGDGSTWTTTFRNPSLGGMLTITGISESNYYAAGRNGHVVYYNGSSFLKDTVKIKYRPGSEYLVNSSVIYKDTVHFLALAEGSTGTVYYHVKGTYKNWKVADSMVISNPASIYKWGWYGLFLINDNRLISAGDQALWEYNNGGWIKILTTSYGMTCVYSVNSNYILAVGDYNTFYFYDGNSWKNLSNLIKTNEDIAVNGVWSDGNEIFIVGYQAGAWPQKTIVWHGK